MKNKILHIILLTAVYCFAISAAPKLFAAIENSTTSAISQEKNILEVSVKLYCPVLSADSIVSSPNNLPVPNIKNHFSDFLAVLQASEHSFLNQLSENTIFLRTVLVQYRKLDLLFPFQYFW